MKKFSFIIIFIVLSNCALKTIDNRYSTISISQKNAIKINSILIQKDLFDVQNSLKKEEENLTFKDFKRILDHEQLFILKSKSFKNDIEISSIRFFPEHLNIFSSENVFFIGEVKSFETSIKSAIKQFGGFDETQKNPDITIVTSGSDNNNFINYIGFGIAISKEVKDDFKFVSLLTQYAKNSNKTINIFAHGAGGRKLYLILLNSIKNQYLDNNGRSVLRVKFYDTPASSANLERVTKLSGATYLGHQANFGDPNSSVFGANGGIFDAIFGILKLWQVFTPTGSQLNYLCEGEFCNYNASNPQPKSQTSIQI